MSVSRIQELVELRMQELAFLESQEEELASMAPELVTTTVRVYEDTLKMLDKVSEELQMKRSELIRFFLDAATREAFTALKVDPLEWYGSGGKKDE